MSTPQKPPPRLVDDPAMSSLVRSDLGNVAGAAPGYDAAAGLSALQAALGTGASVAAGAGAGAGAGATQVAKSTLGLKLAVAGGMGAIAIATAAVLLPPASKSAAPEAPNVVETQQRVATRVPEPVPVIDLAPPPHDSQPRAIPRDGAAAEIAQLAQIKAAVERAPARALRLAEQGHRRFGDGYLHHEREGLAIVALHALGRQNEARTRAARFLARYPHSSLSDRVRSLQAERGDP